MGKRSSKPGAKLTVMHLYKSENDRIYGTNQIDVELRVDGRTGKFHCEVDGNWYEHKDLAELKKLATEAVRQIADKVWRRYLSINYRADCQDVDLLGCTENGWSKRLGLDDNRDEGLTRSSSPRRTRIAEQEEASAIIGIELMWELVEYTDPFRSPGRGVVRLKREVQRSGTAVRHTEDFVDEALPLGTVLYTEERLKLLQEIRNGLREVDAKLLALFGGNADQLAEKLDATTGVLLLDRALDKAP